MVDAIISAVVDDLFSMAVSSIKEEVKLVTGLKDELDKLLKNFVSIQALLDDAEEQQLKEAAVKIWLFNLKTVSYDMDDVLDEWKTWIQTSQFQSSDPITLKHKVFSIFRCNCFTMRDVFIRHVIGGRIKEIHQKLDDIAKDKAWCQPYPTNKSDKDIERGVTASLVGKVKGRDKEKDKVKSKILEAKSNNPYIVSLVGLGGVGKTTLAKLIYNDSEIQNHFEQMMIWVCVSESFDEIRIAKAILESLDSSSRTGDLKELNNVVKEIRAILNQKMFLLVLDDVWNEHYYKWKELKQSLTYGLPGSTILITTRKEKVASIMGCNRESMHRVEILTSEDCWSIISEITLVRDGDKLESIGKRIAEKCKGLPLVAENVGRLLCSKISEKEWLSVLEKDEWESSNALDHLKLSYYDLLLPLKQCFKYCAIFHKGSHNKKERLIRMWMAQGYLRRKKRKEEDLEKVGEDYFDNLVACSLLQISFFKDENRRFIRTWMTQGSLSGKGKKKEKDSEMATKAHFLDWMTRNLLIMFSNDFDDDWFILHDIVSDLAKEFAQDECLVIEVSNGTVSNENPLRLNANARHLTLVIEKDALFPDIHGLNKLRSLIVQFLGYESSLAVDAVKRIFDYLKCVRALDLSKCGIKEVPSSISKLVHLRWLDLSENRNLKELPENLCKCYNLQTLILFNCEALVELPQGIRKLINLMFLDIRSCYNLKYLPKGIGDLLLLKELRDFIVGVNENKTFCIVEMEKLDNLRGRLVIRGLGNVRKIDEARQAQLKKKENVTDLGLIFDGDLVQDEKELLEALEPPSNLEILRLEEYKGKALFPSWMMNLNRLRSLEISKCRCEELPPLGKLLGLEELSLKNMGVKKVGVEFMGIEKENDPSFPKLKILLFDGFLEWEKWDDIDEWMKRVNKQVMPSLQQVGLSNCPKLETLPYCLLSPTITPKLQWLYIREDCRALQQIQEDRLSHIPHLYIP